jgi:putative phosphoserine phosphatase / 1-acylglycerol-3-phosphate O-acyltransferase
MATLDELLDAIEDSPDGPGVAAFFDYDGTVIDGFSASAFYRHRLRNREIGPLELARTLLASAQGIGGGEDFERFLEMALGAWEGRPVSELEELGEHLFKHEIAGRLHWEAWRLAEAHRAKGHRIVLASSATRFQVEPMARELGATEVLCTPVEIVDGRLTGRTAGPALWGDRKAGGMLALASEHELDIEDCFAYSNGTEDIPFLAAAGRPACIDPEPGLADEAARRGWPVLICAPRPGRPGLTEVVRTAGFYGAMAGAFWTGLGAGLLNRSRETLVEITGGVGSDVGLAVAGVDVEVVAGAGNLWSARPCVFVFNHQSKLDPIVMMKLLRGGFTGVAKKEAANVPGFGQFFRLAGVAFIDRGNSAQIREALEPAVRKLRDESTSLVIAPEGTRSATPRLGRFKKGAFHIAMQAGVPIVPIVMRNVGQVMWRGAQAIRSGTVEVCVLDPIETSDWDKTDIAERVEEVRDLFVETLANWPTDAERELEAAR